MPMEKVRNLLYPTVMGKMVSLLLFYKNDFGIE